MSVKSTKFATEMQRRAAAYRGRTVTVKLTGPRWVFWLEYGTAARAEAGHGSGRPYDIRPVNAKALSFLNHALAHVLHPGIRPRAFIRKSLREIQNTVRWIILPSVRQMAPANEIDDVLRKNAMPAVVDILADSLAIEASSEAAALFKQEVQIKS